MNKKELIELLECFVDPDECWFDHHGSCQTHSCGKFNGRCANEVAKEIIKKYKEETNQKIIIIDHCTNCPRSGQSYSGELECNEVNRLIGDFENIPEWCPLPNYKKESNENN